MDFFTQKKVLVRIVIFMAILNLFSIGIFFWMDREEQKTQPPRPSSESVSIILQKELHLTETQSAQIKNLRQKFFEKEKALSASIRNERDSMNVAMFNKNTDEALIKALARKVAENEYEMELLRFEQSKELKTICTPQQLEKFESLVLEIRDYFKPDDPHKKK